MKNFNEMEKNELIKTIEKLEVEKVKKLKNKKTIKTLNRINQINQQIYEAGEWLEGIKENEKKEIKTMKKMRKFDTAVNEWIEAIEALEGNYTPEEWENKTKVDLQRLKALDKAKAEVDHLIEKDHYKGWKNLTDEKDDDQAWFKVGLLLDNLQRRSDLFNDLDALDLF